MSVEKYGNVCFSLNFSGDTDKIESKLKKISEIIPIVKDGILTLAIIIAGIWALLRFDLIESNAAKVKLDLDLQKAKSQTQMSVRMEKTITKIGNGFIINGRFFLKNIGSKDIIVQCNRTPPVSIYKIDLSRVQPAPDRKSKSETYFYAEDGTVQDSLSIDVNNEIAIPFIIQVSQPGFYLINVLVPVTPEDLSQAEKDTGENWTWSDQHIIEIN